MIGRRTGTNRPAEWSGTGMARAYLGVFGLLCIAFLCSENRRGIPWRTVAGGLVLQLAGALLLIGVRAPTGDVLAERRRHGAATRDRDRHRVRVRLPRRAAAAFAETHPGASFILAFQALPLVLTISALASLLFHWGVLQAMTRLFARLLRRALGISGPLALGAAVHVFVGMVEAPLLVRPYLARMQRGELFALMTCGMAGVAGTVMVIYATFLSPLVPNAMGNILIASVISTPAALAVAALMVPFGRPDPAEARATVEDPPTGPMDALVKGTMDGVPILAAIVATLLVTVALVTLVNMGLATAARLGRAADHLAAPVRPSLPASAVADRRALGRDAGRRDADGEQNGAERVRRLPEFLPPAARHVHPRTRMILTYALCGFANFGSLGIMIGGLGAMVPDRRRGRRTSACVRFWRARWRRA